MRPLVAVVMASFERGALLSRSLVCYASQEFPRTEFELIVVDDHSRDNTRSLLLEWSASTGIKTTVITVAPKLEVWRDCGAILNAGIRASSAKHVILTHPEVMPGRKSVAGCVAVLDRFEKNSRKSGSRGFWGEYSCCKPYYLTPRDQARIDTVNWRDDGPLAVRLIEGFYDVEQHSGTHQDYVPWVIEKVGTPGYDHVPSGMNGRVWDSWVFGGCSRETWKKLGGMIESNKWGSVDLLFHQRRELLGMPNYTCTDPQTYCCHQNHDLPGNVLTPRNLDLAHEEADEKALTVEKSVWPAVNHLGWNG